MNQKKTARGERYLLHSLINIVRALPDGAAVKFGAFLGFLLWVFAKRKVDRGEARCVSALGVGVTVARKIVRTSYVNLGRSAAEFIRLKKLLPCLKDLISIEGIAHLDDAISRKRGVLLCTAHMGNWELCGARLALEGYPLAPLYTPQRNRNGLEDLIRQQRTEAAGLDIIPSEGMALRKAFRALKKGNILTFLQDLDARKEGIVVPFLGLPASTATGIVKMYNKFGAPVLPAIAIRNQDGKTHRIIIGKILSDLTDKEGAPFGSNMANSLEMCNNILGDWIRTYPEQWMWLLDRWEFVSRFSK